jgi:hypothetical protein
MPKPLLSIGWHSIAKLNLNDSVLLENYLHTLLSEDDHACNRLAFPCTQIWLRNSANQVELLLELVLQYYSNLTYLIPSYVLVIGVSSPMSLSCLYYQSYSFPFSQVTQ